MKVVEEVWFASNGFLQSEERRRFAHQIKGNFEYLKHFEKFASLSWLRLSNKLSLKDLKLDEGKLQFGDLSHLSTTN